MPNADIPTLSVAAENARRKEWLYMYVAELRRMSVETAIDLNCTGAAELLVS